MTTQKEQPTKVAATRMPHPLYDRIELLAKQERRTKSNMMLVLLEEALAHRARLLETDAQAQGQA